MDVDADAIRVAEENARRAQADVTWLREDIAEVRGLFDTVLMNPPFGAQTKHADLPFLDKALAVARVVYGFHNAVTQEFIVRRIEARGGRVTDRMEYEFPLPPTFPFHRKDVQRVPVVLFRSETAKG